MLRILKREINCKKHFHPWMRDEVVKHVVWTPYQMEHDWWSNINFFFCTLWHEQRIIIKNHEREYILRCIVQYSQFTPQRIQEHKKDAPYSARYARILRQARAMELDATPRSHWSLDVDDRSHIQVIWWTCFTSDPPNSSRGIHGWRYRMGGNSAALA